MNKMKEMFKKFFKNRWVPIVLLSMVSTYFFTVGFIRLGNGRIWIFLLDMLVGGMYAYWAYLRYKNSMPKVDAGDERVIDVTKVEDLDWYVENSVATIGDTRSILSFQVNMKNKLRVQYGHPLIDLDVELAKLEAMRHPECKCVGVAGDECCQMENGVCKNIGRYRY